MSLDGYGFDTFLAHEDLELGVQWEAEILRELKSCDIFVPIFSEDFKESDWASQEIGIAFELQKKILPLNFGINPFGFINKFQAMKIEGKYHYRICQEIIDHLSKDEKYKKDLTDTLIRGFVNSGDFDSANERAEAVRKLNNFNESQVNEIARGYILNNQIQHGFKAREVVVKILRTNKEKIEPTMLENLPSSLL
jgi:hypothetical protein